MEQNDPTKDSKRLRKIPKMSFSSKDLSKRMKKVEGVTMRHARKFVLKRWSSFRDSRRSIATWVLVAGLLVGAAGIQFWWYQKSYTAEAKATEGTYAEAVIGPVETLNPLFAQSSAEEVASKLLFARLMKYDETGKIGYDLASSMKISDNATEYTVKIRPDAQWSDGVYVRARDVVYTVNLIKNPATRSTMAGWEGVLVSAVDDLTVKFTLPAPYTAFPHALQALPIVPEHSLRDSEPSRMREASFSSKPVTSGPYTFRLLQSIDPANERKVVHLARNQHYYRGTPLISRIQLHTYSDTESIKRALATSEVNAANDLSVISAKEASNNRYSANVIPVNSGVYALFNTEAEHLKDVKVRSALQIGTDAKAVRDSIAEGIPSLHLPFVDGQVAGDLPKAPVYDKVAAGKLLDEAGWVLSEGLRKKDGVALELSVVTMKNQDFEQALKTLSGQWMELGVTVKTEVVDPKDVTQNVTQNILQPRRFDVLIYQLSVGADPDVYAYWHSSGSSNGYNFSNYHNPISDEALLSARASSNPALRNAKYVTFAKQWMRDVPAIGLYQGTVQYVHSNKVRVDALSMVLNTPLDRYNSVLYWSIGERRVFTTP